MSAETTVAAAAVTLWEQLAAEAVGRIYLSLRTSQVWVCVRAEGEKIEVVKEEAIISYMRGHGEGAFCWHVSALCDKKDIGSVSPVPVRWELN